MSKGNVQQFMEKVKANFKDRLAGSIVGLLFIVLSFFVGWFFKTAESYITLTTRVDALETSTQDIDLIKKDIAEIKTDLKDTHTTDVGLATGQEHITKKLDNIDAKLDNLTLKLVTSK